MQVQLPPAVTVESENEENITISMSPTEGLALNEVPLNKGALETELARKLKNTGISYVLIRADERIPHGDVDDILKLTKRLRVKRVAFATVPR